MAEHFNPEHADQGGDVLREMEYPNGYKIVVETAVTVDGEEHTFREQFGFDREQYPDGSWTEHVDREISRQIDTGGVKQPPATSVPTTRQHPNR